MAAPNAQKLKPSPGPWRLEDHQGKGQKIVAADGRLIALLHYPKEPTDHANQRLLMRAAVLYERMQALVMFCSGMTLFNVKGKQNPTVVSAQAFIAEIEEPIKPDPPPPAQEVL